jgi:hypothetical protein
MPTTLQHESNLRLPSAHEILWPNWECVYMGEGTIIALLSLASFNLHTLGTETGA